MYDWNEFERFGRLLESQRWIYAKTMPQNPHHYTLRKEWGLDADFDWAVEFLRRHGYRAMFKGRPYTQIDVNQHFYWTMGAPIPKTILINRKVREEPAAYDGIAPGYDTLFSDAASQEEDAALFDLLGDMDGKSVLDIGCGTGLVLRHASPGGYLGIDPSREMLATHRRSWPSERTVCTDLRRFAGDRYGMVLALYGVGSYLSSEEVARIPLLVTPGGRYAVMFYREGYRPRSHSVDSPAFQAGARGLPGKVQEFGDYLLVTGP